MTVNKICFSLVTDIVGSYYTCLEFKKFPDDPIIEPFSSFTHERKLMHYVCIPYKA